VHAQIEDFSRLDETRSDFDRLRRGLHIGRAAWLTCGMTPRRDVVVTLAWRPGIRGRDGVQPAEPPAPTRARIIGRVRRSVSKLIVRPEAWPECDDGLRSMIRKLIVGWVPPLFAQEEPAHGQARISAPSRSLAAANGTSAPCSVFQASLSELPLARAAARLGNGLVVRAPASTHVSSRSMFRRFAP